ncbi:hypothetical protein Btru_048904 [Bulinus truncatus]|nr:hypothetical protein Btru_048904 [Bulinus truncatus]
MGCLFSQLGPAKATCLISLDGGQCLEEEEEPEPSDTVCAGYTAAGISSRQGFSLKQSWKGIKRKMEDTGVEMFVRLFRSNSELQVMFKGFKDIKSDSELRSNEALENHATLVMSTLDDAITHIDNYDYVKDLLYKTSVTHTKFTGFQPGFFMHVKEPFLEAVRVTLGDRYTDNMQNIYTIAITYVLQTLQEGMEEALKK